MTKLNLLTLLLFTSFCLNLRAETIKGTCDLRASPKGPILFTLKAGQEVECGKLVNGWFKISVMIKTTQKQFDAGYEVKKGDKLVDLKGIFLAVAKADVPAELGMLSNSYMEIFGYVPASNIDQNSIPENSLDAILRSKTDQLRYKDLREFLKKNEYFKADLIHKTLPQMDEYCIYESTVLDPSPGYRIGLIFEKGELIAIEHSRPLKVSYGQEYTVLGSNKVFIIKRPKSISEKAFVKKLSDSNIGAD